MYWKMLGFDDRYKAVMEAGMPLVPASVEL
jgi:hypothetical protein